MAHKNDTRAVGGFAAGPRKVAQARVILFFERAAPAIVVASAPLVLIVALGLFDLWRFAGLWGHAAALILLIALAAVLFWRLRPAVLWPPREEALARIERDGLMRHEPLRSLEDSPASGADTLWKAHLADARARATSAKLVAPAATANAVDPHGVRYAALALLIIGGVTAGDEGPRRIVDAFRPSDPSIARAGFADLWIEPPAYTGKAPVYLLRANEPLGALRKQIDAPQGSIVRIQTKPGARYRLSLRTERETTKAALEGGTKSGRASLTLTNSGALTLSAGGRTARWPLGVIIDRAPTVEFVEPPAPDSNGRLTVSLEIEDDYGAASVALEILLDPDQPRPLDEPPISSDVAQTAEQVPLDSLKGPPGKRSAIVDLTSHPWSGLSVIVTAVIRDAAGQEAKSLPVTLRLPAREFFNPLAKSVIEQRQTLAVAPAVWRRVEWALSGLTLAPEYFFEKPSDYLLLRTAMWRVNKRAGESPKETVSEFWPLALQLEDETLELARQRLDAARAALRDALESGAADAEIERLTEAMRGALQQYLEALAQSGEESDPDAPISDQTVSAADLEAMLDSVKDLAKKGASNAARQALAELEQLLENLRRPGGGAGGDGASGQSGQQGQGGQAGAVGDLIGRQRALADEAFRRGETKGVSGDDLADDQSRLAGDLADVMRSLEDSNRDSSAGASESGKALSRALSAMRRSEEALGVEKFDDARGAMEEAIANLREGAEALAKSERAKAQAARGTGGQPARDPLGRPIGPSTGQDVEVPEQSDAQRARELLEELRRRLSDGDRTEAEIRYLERLLERF
ncbi:MAG: TIGR02302 family protein [Parvularculaceae bacterium]|nr:TIGR02302 family protein [Parvularculaceae bacterium]